MKALAKRNPSTTTNWIVGIVIVGFIIWFLTKNKGIMGNKASTYINTKTWDITYNEDGLPVRISKHVNARTE